MNQKSLFAQIIFTVIVAVICLVLTVGLAILVGSLNVELFDFQSMNFSNMIPVFIVGGFISCVIIGICVLFVSRTAFYKAKDYFEENNKENGGTNK